MPCNTNTANGIVRLVSQEGKITGSKHDVPTGDVKVTLRYYPSTSVIEEGLNNLVVSGNYRFDGYTDIGTIEVTYKKPFTYSLTQQHKEPTYKRVGPYTLQGSFSAQTITTSSTTNANEINYRSVKYDYDSVMVEAERTSAVTKDFRIADPTAQYTLSYRALIGNRFKYDHMVDENYQIISSIDFGNDFYETGTGYNIKPCITPTRLVAEYNKWGTAKTTLVWEKKMPEGSEADENGKWYICVKDLSGNMTKEEINITNIDNTAPEINISEFDETNKIIKGEITDEESGVVAYAVTKTVSKPTSWIIIENTKKFDKLNYQITKKGTYYIWAKDASGNTSRSKAIDLNWVN